GWSARRFAWRSSRATLAAPLTGQFEAAHRPRRRASPHLGTPRDVGSIYCGRLFCLRSLMRVTSGTNLMMRLMGNGALKYSCTLSNLPFFIWSTRQILCAALTLLNHGKEAMLVISTQRWSPSVNHPSISMYWPFAASWVRVVCATPRNAATSSYPRAV